MPWVVDVCDGRTHGIRLKMMIGPRAVGRSGVVANGRDTAVGATVDGWTFGASTPKARW